MLAPAGAWCPNNCELLMICERIIFVIIHELSASGILNLTNNKCSHIQNFIDITLEGSANSSLHRYI